MKLKNTYYCLRHGRSTANEAELVVSLPENGVPEYGLSESGRVDTIARLTREEIIAAGFALPHATRAASEGPAANDVLCYTSDFRRAHETARVFCESLALPAPAPIIDRRLRERGFGSFELQSSENYPTVWERDRTDAEHNFHGVESTASVARRLQSFLDEMERTHSGKRIVCVSHGDPSQIFQTIFAGLAPNQHRTLPHLENAELRKLNANE